MNSESTCNLCGDKNISKVYKDFYGCGYCFHINKKSETIKNKLDIKYDFDITEFHKYVLEEIDSIDVSEYIKTKRNFNVLVINDRNTVLIDSIKGKLLNKMSKYNIKTVSLSSYYNNSFFSAHNHNKYNLSNYTTDMLENEYGTFDVIVLNDALNWCNNINEVISCCKRLMNRSTSLFSVNLHSYLLYSTSLFALNKFTNNIFNTNSLKTLCDKNDLCLQNSEIIQDHWIISKIDTKRQPNVSKGVVEVLYEEITHGMYDQQSFDLIRNYWSQYTDIIQQTLSKYKNLGFNIIILNNLRVDLFYIDLDYDIYIETINVSQLTETQSKTLVVILDYKNIENIQSEIKSLSNVKTWLIFDIGYMIAYNV
jgi:SAM-dependent methyltransferase